MLKLSRAGNEDVGEMDEAELEATVKALGMEIYDEVWNLLDMAGVNLQEAFGEKARLNEGR